MQFINTNQYEEFSVITLHGNSTLMPVLAVIFHKPLIENSWLPMRNLLPYTGKMYAVEKMYCRGCDLGYTASIKPRGEYTATIDIDYLHFVCLLMILLYSMWCSKLRALWFTEQVSSPSLFIALWFA